MTAEPLIAGRKPVLVALKAGRPVLWCSCGRSENQPLCNGAHKGTEFMPVRYVPEADGEALLCTCKRTRTPPFCDGSHNALSETYAEADPDAASDARMVDWSAPENGVSRASLDNGCFAARVDEAAFTQYGALALARVMSRDSGASHLSYYSGRMAKGASSVLTFPGSDIALFAVDGPLDLVISGRAFRLEPESGAYIRGEEAFTVHNTNASSVRVEIAVCPECEVMQTLDSMPDNFDQTAPQRVVDVDPDKRETMADRFYQVLVDQAVGGCNVTQFIGEIPKSRAEHHRHLYEEALLVLRGDGVMWTDNTKAPVKAGDLIFLPMRQHHSLECLSPDGMRLMGVFFPSGSPAINY